MSRLSLGTRVSNLKSVALTVLELLHLTPKNLGGHVTLATPPFGKTFLGHVQTVPGNTCVKFQVRADWRAIVQLCQRQSGALFKLYVLLRELLVRPISQHVHK